MRGSKTAIVIIIILVVLSAAAGWLYVSGYFSSQTKQTTQQPVEPKPTPEDRLACIDALPTDIKIGQKVMAAGYSDQLSDEAAVFNKASIGGVIIMDQASGSEIGVFRNAQAIVPTVATDQEGGTVQRYTQNGVLPGETDMAGNVSTEQAYNLYLKDDHYLKSIGITTNFSPIVGVISITPSPLPGRMYGYSPAVVAKYATQSIKAAQAAGITPVIKHFPGLGSATGNTDYGSATTDPIATLKTRDLIPYTTLANLHPDVMVSNAVVPDLTDGQPAVWSSAAVALLRSEGYQQSVVYTDSLTARAIPGSLSDAVIKSWQAGDDVALIVQTRDQTVDLTSYFDAIVAKATDALQSGALDNKAFNASIDRIFVRKNIDPCQLKDTLSQLKK